MQFLLLFVAGGLFEGGLFDDTPMAEIRPPEVSAIEATPVAEAPDSDDDMDRFGGPPSVGGARYFNKNNYKYLENFSFLAKIQIES